LFPCRGKIETQKGIFMSIADIACIIRVAEEAPLAALDQAIALAAARKARLTVTVAAQLIVPLYTPFYSGLVGGLTAEANERTRALAAKTAEEASSRAKLAGVTADISSTLDLVGAAAANAVRSARVSDIIIVDQSAGMVDTKEAILEEALFHSGRPVLVVPPKGKPASKFSRLMVAWDGSAVAARALGDALAMFPEAKTVEIVVVSGEKDLSKSLAGADCAAHVSRKGREAVLTEIPVTREGVGAALDAHAVKTGADAIVMGAFGHSRLRQFILGGATSSLTQSASVPLFMAH
jgi:nucleotide-binding universal stress UspA family protein